MVATASEDVLADDFRDISFRRVAVAFRELLLEVKDSATAATRVTAPRTLFKVHRERWSSVVMERAAGLLFCAMPGKSLAFESGLEVFLAVLALESTNHCVTSTLE